MRRNSTHQATPAIADALQKEVERRRRENINEGIMDIVAQVPGGSDPKVGKGILLKRAADYLQNLKNKVEHLTVDVASKDREKQEYAVSWRDGEVNESRSEGTEDKRGQHRGCLDPPATRQCPPSRHGSGTEDKEDRPGGLSLNIRRN